MSIWIYFVIKNCYKSVMTPTELGNWFEKQFLLWQLDHGRSTIDDFAKILGVSRSYLSMLMQGERKNMSYERAYEIAQKLNNYEIFDILGYERPELSDLKLEDALSDFPPEFSERLTGALEEARAAISEKGITRDTPEARLIIIRAFERHGFKLTDIVWEE